MAGSGCGQDAILADQKLLDTVGSTNLGDQLNDFGVPETTITTNDEESAWRNNKVSGYGCKRRQLAHACRSRLTLSSLGNGQQNAGYKSFTVVRLLEDSDLLAETGTDALSEGQIDTAR